MNRNRCNCCFCCCFDRENCKNNWGWEHENKSHKCCHCEHEKEFPKCCCCCEREKEFPKCECAHDKFSNKKFGFMGKSKDEDFCDCQKSNWNQSENNFVW